MEIRNLTTFVQVAELNSFTRAAQTLGYSQSTVSFQIKQLEQELNCLLFERINHTLTLTEKGREVLAYAQNVCRMTDEFRENFEDAKDVRGRVHIVTPDSICEYMMTRNYQDFFAHYPGIALKFSTADTNDMFRILDHNEADIMLTLDTHVYQNDYVIAKEERAPTHFVVGSHSPLAGRRNLSIRELMENYPFILTEKGMGYRHALDQALERMSLQIQPVLEIGRTDIIRSLLEKGPGISFLPDLVTQNAVEAGRLVRLDVCDVEVDIWKQLIYHRNKWISRSLEAFIQYVMIQEFDT